MRSSCPRAPPRSASGHFASPIGHKAGRVWRSSLSAQMNENRSLLRCDHLCALTCSVTGATYRPVAIKAVDHSNGPCDGITLTPAVGRLPTREEYSPMPTLIRSPRPCLRALHRLLLPDWQSPSPPAHPHWRGPPGRLIGAPRELPPHRRRGAPSLRRRPPRPPGIRRAGPMGPDDAQRSWRRSPNWMNAVWEYRTRTARLPSVQRLRSLNLALSTASCDPALMA